MINAAWTFYNPVVLHVGRGCRKKVMALAQEASVLIVTTARGRKQAEADEVLGQFLMVCASVHWIDSVTENPDLHYLQEQIDSLRQRKFSLVIGFGGGSAIDAAKALSIGLSSKLTSFKLAELIKQPSLHETMMPLPLYILPTTAGTGSEVTPFATVWDHQNKKKLSLAGQSVFPRAAFVDADLMDGLPLEITLSTGLDAINQAAESTWNKNANPLTLAYAYRALVLGFHALPKLAAGVGGAEEREQMAEASLFAGLAISHTRTALCHSISYPLTAHFGVPHGLACAFTMPAVLRHNLQAEDGRFAELSLRLVGSQDLDKLVACFDDLYDLLQVRRRVKTFIPSLESLLTLRNEMITPGRAGNNLYEPVDIGNILRFSWG